VNRWLFCTTAAVATALSACYVESGTAPPAQVASGEVLVAEPPPPPPAPVEAAPPPPPAADTEWVPGYQRWNGHGYQYERGHYEHRPRASARWVAGHWERRGRGSAWVDAHWE
jgi:hypothetical protein